VEQLDGSVTHNEDNLINELKSEKQKFEQNMQQIMTGSMVEDSSLERQGSFHSQRPQSGKVALSEEELIRFNSELKGAFKDMLEMVEQNQIQAMNGLSQKQTEMFQLSNKYRMPSGFKNDAIGVWYDAKSSVTQ
jgi:hypothetical protein